jgi:hypothetical protein
MDENLLPGKNETSYYYEPSYENCGAATTQQNTREIVILSVAAASRSEAAAESKDPGLAGATMDASGNSYDAR